MDPLILARIQFAANISFHILFPTITIALGWVLLFFKLRHRATGDRNGARPTPRGSRCSR
jgi:cytochrome d ubiquinol oxidase subunit I